MYFDSIQAALAMDGHGTFVWAAYAITLAVLALMLWLPARRERWLRRELAGNFRRNEAAGVALAQTNQAGE